MDDNNINQIIKHWSLIMRTLFNSLSINKGHFDRFKLDGHTVKTGTLTEVMFSYSFSGDFGGNMEAFVGCFSVFFNSIYNVIPCKPAINE